MDRDAPPAVLQAGKNSKDATCVASVLFAGPRRSLPEDGASRSMTVPGSAERYR
jgi:hypothetical protein